MNEFLKRESLWTIAGLATLVGGFLFLVFLPGQKRLEKLQQEIRAAEQTARQFPLKLNNERQLLEEIERRQQFLNLAREAIPTESNEAAVIRCIHELAQLAQLQLRMLEPRAPVQAEVFQELGFQVSYTGRFPELLQFLRGLESASRAYQIQSLFIGLQDGPFQSDLAGELVFAGYASSIENNDSSGNADDSDSPSADTENVGTAMR